MICGAIQKCQIIFLTAVIANPQFPMPHPMFGSLSMMPQPPFSMMGASAFNMSGSFPNFPAQPLSMPMQIGLAIVDEETTIKSTTETPLTTEKPKEEDIGIALPLPMSFNMQMPMQAPMPMPAMMPMPAPSPMLFGVPGRMSSICKKNKNHPNCPPCPPCSCSPCTPSFFSYCSSCHQKCRCKNPKDVPIVPPPKAPFPFTGPAYPMPYPAPLPMSPNAAYIPFPPRFSHFKRFKKHYSKGHDSGSDSYEDYIKKPKKKNRKYGTYRRSGKRLDLDRSDDLDTKPVLSFQTNDGKIAMQRHLNKDDATMLMGDDDPVMLISDDGTGQLRANKQRKDENNRKKVVLSYPYVKRGKKKMVFRPPKDMMVGNLSISFNT